MIVQNITVTTVTVTLLIKKSLFSLHVSEIFRTFATVLLTFKPLSIWKKQKRKEPVKR